jgi:adenylate cyclase
MNDVLQLTPNAVQAQLERILSSPRFASAPQLANFLRFVVEESLSGNARGIKQYSIAVKAFGRDPGFNPEADPIVRIEARRLRRALERYYRELGAQDPIRIEIPVGTYIPIFRSKGHDSDTGYQTAGTPAQSQDEANLTLPSGPSILVLPLEVLAHDAEQVYFADGLTEQLAVALTAFQDFLIVGPLARDRLKALGPLSLRALGQRFGARFVLQGRLRKGGDRVRMSVSLIDVGTRGTLWAKTFDGRLDAADLFAFEDAVTGQIAATLADHFGVIPRALTRGALEKRTESLEAYDAVLRYYHYFTVLTGDAWSAAYGALERAVELDPRYALTHALLADMVGAEYHLLGADSACLARMEDLVQRALQFDTQCQHAHQMKAMTHFFHGQRDLFISEADLTVRLNPNHAGASASCGLFLTIVGEEEHGLVLLKKAMRMNPHHPGWYYLGPFIETYRNGDYQKALQAATRINTPGLYLDPLARAAALGQLGRVGEAGAALEEMQRALPDTDIGLRELMRRTLFPDENVDILLEGLQKAELAAVD